MNPCSPKSNIYISSYSKIKEVKTMAEKVYTIRVNSTEENKDKGFALLSGANFSFICLEDEKYVIPESGVELLKKEGVKFEPLDNNKKSEEVRIQD